MVEELETGVDRVDVAERRVGAMEAELIEALRNRAWLEKTEKTTSDFSSFTAPHEVVPWLTLTVLAACVNRKPALQPADCPT